MGIGLSRNKADEYKCIACVGSGSFGSVYRAQKRGSNGHVAIKKILLRPEDIIKLKAGDAMIQEEVKILQECNHPNIIKYHDSFIQGRETLWLWIVTEYCCGNSLQQFYQKNGSLSEQQIAFVCYETLKGLQYLHGKNLIHRDIKSGNILLTHVGGIKLADFGITAQLTETKMQRTTLAGTPHFMAPEVAKNKPEVMMNNEIRRINYPYNMAADIWSLGITAIELAEDKTNSFFEVAELEVIKRMKNADYEAPKLEDAKWSLRFREFVRLCLTIDPQNRPTALQLLENDEFVIGEISHLFIFNGDWSIFDDFHCELTSCPGEIFETQKMDRNTAEYSIEEIWQPTLTVIRGSFLTDFARFLTEQNPWYHSLMVMMPRDGIEEREFVMMDVCDENFVLQKSCLTSSTFPIIETAPPSDFQGLPTIYIEFTADSSTRTSPKVINFLHLAKPLLKDRSLEIHNLGVRSNREIDNQNLNDVLDVFESFKSIKIWRPYVDPLLYLLNRPNILKSNKIQLAFCHFRNSRNLINILNWLLYPTNEAKCLSLLSFDSKEEDELFQLIIQNFHDAVSSRTFFVIFEKNVGINNGSLPSINEITGETLSFTRINGKFIPTEKFLLARTIGAVPNGEEIYNSFYCEKKLN